MMASAGRHSNMLFDRKLILRPVPKGTSKERTAESSGLKSDFNSSVTTANSLQQLPTCQVGIDSVRARETYVWRIEGFDLLSLECGAAFRSKRFELCGREWQLSVCPGGSTTEVKDYVSCFLRFYSYASISVQADITVVGQADDHSGILTREFTGADYDREWGWPDYLSRAKFCNKENGFCVDGVVTIKVAMSKVTSVLSEGISNNHSRLASLQGGMRTLLRDEMIPRDITFRFSGTDEVIGAHRNILMAMSPVFRAKFH
jgi:hypothetical protein